MARQYVGIDLHRRRSAVVRKNESGDVLSVRRIDNDPLNPVSAVADADEKSDVILTTVSQPVSGKRPSAIRGGGHDQRERGVTWTHCDSSFDRR